MEAIVFMICVACVVSQFINRYFNDKAEQREHELMFTQHYDGEDVPAPVDDEPVPSSRYGGNGE